MKLNNMNKKYKKIQQQRVCVYGYSYNNREMGFIRK